MKIPERLKPLVHDGVIDSVLRLTHSSTKI